MRGIPAVFSVWRCMRFRRGIVRRCTVWRLCTLSHAALGIPENLAKGCIYHHRMLDHSPKRQEMKLIFETYLRNHYPDWEESRLYYTRKEHNFAKREEQGTAQVTALVKEETGVSLQ